MDHGVIILTIILSAKTHQLQVLFVAMVSCIVNSTVTLRVDHWWISTIVQQMLQATGGQEKNTSMAALHKMIFSQHVFPSDPSFASQSDYHAWIRRVKTHKYDSFASSSLFWWLPEKWRSTLKRCRNSLLPNTFRKTAQLGRWCKCTYVWKVLICEPKYQDI